MWRRVLVLIGIVILIMTGASFAGDYGDLNNDGFVNILDIVYFVNYKYKAGPAPDSQEFTADVNNDGTINTFDIVHLINYIYVQDSHISFSRQMKSANASIVANPAAVYCTELGYQYNIVDGPGGQHGICTFPDGSSCSDWAFLNGQCGQAYSYCALNGYRTKILSDGKNSLSIEYCVCVDDKGKEVGSVAELSGVMEKAVGKSDISRMVPDNSPEVSYLQRAPSSLDWRNNNGDWTTPVKDQGICGSCWAFSAVGTAESAFNIHYNNPNLDMDLSEQYLVSDCSGSGNCSGGWKHAALNYIRTDGIPGESCMPYVDGMADGCDASCSMCTYVCSDRTCSDRCAGYITQLSKLGTIYYVSASIPVIEDAIYNKGPVSVSLGIGDGVGGSFDGDVYRCIDDANSNHAVIIVGYYDSGIPATSYWIVKNSWGSTWNGDGYYKVGFNECGIQNDVISVDMTTYCGDNACTGFETCETCEHDCGICNYCGNGICDHGETCATCSQDCGNCYCGDGLCTPGESYENCPADCGHVGSQYYLFDIDKDIDMLNSEKSVESFKTSTGK